MRFCIVGTGRSGTTLLRKILNSHPDTFVYNETHWLPKMYEFFGLGECYAEDLLQIINNTFHVNGALVTDLVGLDRESFLSQFDGKTTIKQFCDLLGSVIAEKDGKLFWGDKTPDYGPWMTVVQKIWPQCKFIHITRHGADAALSMSTHPGYQWLASAKEDSWVSAAYNQYYRAVQPNPVSLEEYAKLWYRRLVRIQNESLHLTHGSYLEIKLESLAEEPKRMLIDVARFLDISTPESWLEAAKAEIRPDRLKIKAKHRNLEILSEDSIKLLHQMGYE